MKKKLLTRFFREGVPKKIKIRIFVDNKLGVPTRGRGGPLLLLSTLFFVSGVVIIFTLISVTSAKQVVHSHSLTPVCCFLSWLRHFCREKNLLPQSGQRRALSFLSMWNMACLTSLSCLVVWNWQPDLSQDCHILKHCKVWDIAKHLNMHSNNAYN